MDKREQIARRIAQELRDGYYVNLGIGIPTLVANFVPPGMEVPPGKLVLGVPGKVVRDLTPTQIEGNRENAAEYVRLRVVVFGLTASAISSARGRFRERSKKIGAVRRPPGAGAGRLRRVTNGIQNPGLQPVF